MLVLTRKVEQGVIIGGAGTPHPMLTVTVLGIDGGQVRLGFHVDPSVPVHRLEVWQRIHARGGPGSPAAGPPLDGAG